MNKSNFLSSILRQIGVVAIAAANMFAPAASGQVLLYEEMFPFPGASGSFPVSSCGWSNAIPNNPSRLYQVSGDDGAVYAYQSGTDVPINTMFFTTTTLESGTNGMAFQSIDPTLYRSLTLSADLSPYYDPDNVTARFAVQINGTNWYCATTPLPVPTSQASTFVTYTRQFNSAATNWNTLTFNSTRATIGGAAASNLAGLITGAGLVFSHTVDDGTHNLDNFRITAEIEMPKLTITGLSSGVVSLSWFGSSDTLLQSSTNLAGGLWTDLSNTLAQSTASLPATEPQKFFRVKSVPGLGVPLNLANLGFESNGAPAGDPLGWVTTGNTAADAVISYDANSGVFCLQHTNSADYQVENSLLITNLLNGYYRLNAFTKSSGGQKACYIAAKDKLTSLPPIPANWTETVVRGINVTNGQCQIRIHSDASTGNWCRVDSITLTRDNIAYNFLKGGDISELPRVEHYGGKYYDNGVEKDCLQIMKDHGCNIVRIRMYNDPGNPNFYPANQLDPLGWQNPARTLALCQRAKALGLQIQLTFHYSDYWTNGGLQYKPHEWEGLNTARLLTKLYDYTRDFMLQLRDVGIYPEFVSLGNETNGGLLFPNGNISETGGWDNYADMLKQGYNAVKSVSPTSQVVIHIDRVEAGTVNWYFGQLNSRSVPYDVIGCSYYPFWTNMTTEQARNAINSWQGNFNKPVLIMETGYNWNPTASDGYAGQLSNNGPEVFPSTPLGQKHFMLKLFNDLKRVNGGNCIGDLYWDPVFIAVPGLGWANGGRNVVDNTTLFNFAGHALPSLDAFFYNN